LERPHLDAVSDGGRVHHRVESREGVPTEALQLVAGDHVLQPGVLPFEFPDLHFEFNDFVVLVFNQALFLLAEFVFPREVRLERLLGVMRSRLVVANSAPVGQIVLQALLIVLAGVGAREGLLAELRMLVELRGRRLASIRKSSQA